CGFALGQILLLLAAVAVCGGCAAPGAPDRTVIVPRGAEWDGIVIRQLQDAGSEVAVMDVDLRTPGIQVEIASADPRRGGAALSGQAFTVADWLTTTAALGGVNGGFFGRELGDGRKQLVGVFVRNGRALAAAPPLRS